MKDPKLRTVSGVKEPYPLGKFPKKFEYSVAEQISIAIATGRTDIAGEEWERIFSKAIGATWKPSNVGLDDILVPEISAAWGAKSVKNKKPFSAKVVRLISGRNSLQYSYGIDNAKELEVSRLGSLVLGIWNERVAALYQKYKTLRTVVLLKGEGLRQISIFEIPTIRYNSEEYLWSWNKDGNLLGKTADGRNKFTWQPHGSQFTIHEPIPDYVLNIEIQVPEVISPDKILEMINFSENSYRIISRETLK